MKLYDTYKDSGIDWIGEIPSHWATKKTAWLFNLIGSGTTPKTDCKEYYDEDGLNWLQTGDLNDGTISETSKKISQLAVDDLGLKFYPKESVVIAMYGATIGKMGILDIETATNQACCVLAKSKEMLPKYTFYTYLVAKESLILKSSGGGQPNISQDKIKSHYIPVPPMAEQQAIAEYLDEQCSKIDRQIAVAKRQIELLKELKQTVISDAVTGKVKVTND